MLAAIFPRKLHDPVDFLQIEPPLFLGVRLALAHEIIAPYREASRQTRMSHCPTHGSMKGCIRFIPGADLDAGATA